MVATVATLGASALVLRLMLDFAGSSGNASLVEGGDTRSLLAVRQPGTGSAEQELAACAGPFSQLGEHKVEYIGGFRLKLAYQGNHGAGRVQHSTGALDVEGDKIWVSGHPDTYSVGAFEYLEPVPTDSMKEMPISQNVVKFERVSDIQYGFKLIITGIEHIGGELVVHTAQYYSGQDTFRDHQTVFGSNNAFTVQGHTQAAGWMKPVPPEWQERLGGPWLMGYASNLPINGRLSQGPSLYAWDGVPGKDIDTVKHLDYTLENPLGTYGRDPAQAGVLAPANGLWNEISSAYVGFIRDDDYIVVGRTGGLVSGIGYKDKRSNGTLMGGYGTYDVDDVYNYYWIYDLNDVISAEAPYMPKPYASGKFEAYTEGRIVGADYEYGQLFIMSFSQTRLQSPYESEPVITVHRFCS